MNSLLNKLLSYIVSRDSITVCLDGRTIPVGKSHEAYPQVLEAVKAHDEATLRKLLLPKDEVVRQANLGDDAGKVSLVDGELYYNNEVIHTALTSRILSMFKDGFNIKPLLNFLANLEDNPSYTARQELYGFLEACRLPITEDGHFLAYKIVNRDYKDKHTGTMDNSIGATPRMQRKDVNDNRNETCSNGLHFCSEEYARSGFGSESSGDHMMVVKVNPANVVSIPVDYNNSKGRACEYLILEEISWKARLDYGDNFGQSHADDDTEEEEQEEEEQEDDDSDDTVTVAAPAPVLGSAANVGTKTTSPETVAKVLKLLSDGVTLTATAQIAGVSRRQAARIRDGLVK